MNVYVYVYVCVNVSVSESVFVNVCVYYFLLCQDEGNSFGAAPTPEAFAAVWDELHPSGQAGQDPSVVFLPSQNKFGYVGKITLITRRLDSDMLCLSPRLSVSLFVSL